MLGMSKHLSDDELERYVGIRLTAKQKALIRAEQSIIGEAKAAIGMGNVEAAFLSLVELMAFRNPDDSIGKHLSILQSAALRRFKQGPDVCSRCQRPVHASLHYDPEAPGHHTAQRRIP